jgi:hypothetical protein
MNGAAAGDTALETTVCETSGYFVILAVGSEKVLPARLGLQSILGSGKRIAQSNGSHDYFKQTWTANA